MAKKTRKRIKIVFEPDVDGWWVVTVPAVQGCLTSARTIEQGRRRIREAYAAATGDDRTAETAELELDVRLPAGPRKTLKAAREARSNLQQATDRAAELTLKAARALLGSGLSTRDAGEILGLSRQRLQQLGKT